VSFRKIENKGHWKTLRVVPLSIGQDKTISEQKCFRRFQIAQDSETCQYRKSISADASILTLLLALLSNVFFFYKEKQ
jgi:hypothetical protein